MSPADADDNTDANWARGSDGEGLAALYPLDNLASGISIDVPRGRPMALNHAALACLPEQVTSFAYDRSRVTPGIVHFSTGNFHRAHQAYYLDRMLHLPGNEHWGICGIGLLDDRTERLKAETFPDQDNLYVLTECPPKGQRTHRLIGAIVEYIFAPGNQAAVLARLSDPATHIISMTITEGGYNIDEATGAFRLDHPDVAHDLTQPRMPRTVFGFVTEALARRRAAGLPPFTVLSCDNLRRNGDVARRAFLGFARARDAALADWIERNVTFPSCMVDRITPAVRKREADRLNAESGIGDRLPVFCEDFAQWVVEDKFCSRRPALEAVGVQFVDTVHDYEQAKLRILNASHSMLVYPAALAGYATVAEAMGDPRLRMLLDSFLDRDVIPLLAIPKGMTLGAYKTLVLQRFTNPAIEDQLPRIAADGVSKIPEFLSETLTEVVGQGREHRRLAFLLASFGEFLLAKSDLQLAASEPRATEHDIALIRHPEGAAMLGLSSFGDWGLRQSAAFVADLVRYRARIAACGVLAALSELLAETDMV